jgi:hypothetical protein
MNRFFAEGATSPRFSELKYWALSLLLILPVVLLYCSHFFLKAEDLIPSGFLAVDMPVYMANAREHFDNGFFQLTYGNPFSPFYETPPIYFQPQTLLLGISWRVLKWDPGMIFMVFGFFSALICARIGIALYREVVGLKSWFHRLGLVIFFYGGGLLAISGLVFSLNNGFGANNIFRFDPFDGWWFLNFGRNLVFPTEALYHALFLGSILLLIRKKYLISLLICAVLSISHPFTGIELILIILGWSFLEKFFLQNQSLPKYFFPCCIALAIYHLGSYGFLNIVAEHRQMVSQWSVPWVLKIENIIPAYFLVGTLALWRMRSLSMAAEFFADINNRLFVVWFVIAFILANHEFLIDPIQPIHFSRGYIWIPLFLMGSKTLLDLFHYIKRKTARLFRAILLVFVMCTFLSDNSIWITTQIINNYDGNARLGLYLTKPQKEILNWVNRNDFKNHLVLSQDGQLSYYLTCYTPLRSWHSHYFNTPYAQLRRSQLNALFGRGEFLEYWQKKNLLVIFRGEMASKVVEHQPTWLRDRNGIRIFQNSDYVVYKLSR